MSSNVISITFLCIKILVVSHSIKFIYGTALDCETQLGLI